MDSPIIPEIQLADYTYNLPQHRIADFPLPNRDESKLLVATAGNGSISHSEFQHLAEYIPKNSMMVFNNTKVIPARLIMKKPTGGEVELLLIEPIVPAVAQLALQQTGTTTWMCIVGGKNVREQSTLTVQSQGITLTAYVKSRTENKAEVEFTITPNNTTLADAISVIGAIPLPPYIKRTANTHDTERYQTVYAQHNGSVAAPTAGLHFTPNVLESLQRKNITQSNVTLHVGLGTFLPIQSESIANHAMHKERITIDIETIITLRDFFATRTTELRFVCVGTTSVRTIESLYWIGVRLLQNEISLLTDVLLLRQWDCYRLSKTTLPTVAESLQCIIANLQEKGLDYLSGETEIIIVPGYEFTCCDTLITNFHQPQSTLILLVAAFTGGMFWKDIYSSALENNYRFLSYGDSSILFR